MYVCMYGWKVQGKTQNKRKKNQTGIGKQEKDVMRGRIGIDCNTTGTNLPGIIG